MWVQKYSTDNSTRSTVKFLFRRSLDNANRLTVRGDRSYIKIKEMKDERLRLQLEQLAADVVNVFNGESLTPLTYTRHSVTFHLAGSLRMGKPGVSVVDTNLRFHEFDNLYCCDLSVFPDIPASNPSLTLGALALRLARTL
ncbi:Pyridoxine 4-oxidase [compost metagenome]